MIGATKGKEPDWIADDETMSLNEMRGAMKDMHKAKLSLNQKATVESCLVEIDITKQKMENLHEQMRRLIGMYQTLQDEFTQYKQQRVMELNMKVNGGSTSPEDDA